VVAARYRKKSRSILPAIFIHTLFKIGAHY